MAKVKYTLTDSYNRRSVERARSLGIEGGDGAELSHRRNYKAGFLQTARALLLGINPYNTEHISPEALQNGMEV